MAEDEHRLDDLLAIAEPLARMPTRELILVRLVSDDRDLAEASAVLAGRRSTLAQRGVSCRVAAYTALERGSEAVQLATEQDVDLILVDASPELAASGRLDEQLRVVLERAPCDVAVFQLAAPTPKVRS